MIPWTQPLTRRAVPRPRTGETPIQHVRVAQEDWDDLHEVTRGRRSEVIREFIRWYLRRPGARIPERPSAEVIAEVVRARTEEQ